MSRSTGGRPRRDPGGAARGERFVERDPNTLPDPLGVGAILDDMLRARPWRAGVALGQLARTWPDAVGERLAEEARPRKLDQGVLIVECSSAAWGAQVSFLSREIASRLNRHLGDEVVRRLRVVVEDRTANG